MTNDMHILRRFNLGVPINNWLNICTYLVIKNIDYVWDACWKNSKIWTKINKMRILSDIFDHWILLKTHILYEELYHCLKSTIRICYGVVQIELFLQWVSHTWSMILVTSDIHILGRFNMHVPINNWLSICMYLVRKNIDYVWDAYWKNSNIWIKINEMRSLSDIFDHWILLKRIYCMKSCMHCLKITIRICYNVIQIELLLQ